MKKVLVIFISIFMVSCGNKKEEGFYGKKNNSFKESYERGRVVYNDLCITCHLQNGEGVPKAFPPLANSDYLEQNQDLSIKGIKFGMSGEIVVNGDTYNSVMVAMDLNDEDVADVMNYINKSWGNNYGEIVIPEKVTKITP